MAGTASRLTSLLCCPCRCLLTVLACVLLTAGLVALALYLLFRPHLIHATAAAADLSNFTLTTKTWLLRYNLSLALAIRNPNKRIAIHYDAVAAEAYYQGQRFAHADLPPFFQDTAAETADINPAFLGQHPLVGGVAAAGFRREATEGRFSVDVKLSARMKLKVWAFRLPGPKPKIDCPLRLQRRNATAGAAPPKFQPTDCRVWF